MNCIYSYYFIPETTKPTRFSSNISGVPSLIDQIRTIFIRISISWILSIDITFHCPIIFLLPIDNEKIINGKTKITFCDQSYQRTSSFMNTISDLYCSSIVARDPSTYVDNFLNTSNDLYCKLFPLCSKLISKKRLF